MNPSLDRLLSPRSVAVVGASERRRMSNTAVGHLRTAGVELHLVHPGGGSAYGQATVRSLTEIGRPVDAVLSLVGASPAVEVVEEAGATGCGGVVVVASGFADAGAEGAALQDRLRASALATGTAVLGPNCTGFVNAGRGVALFTGSAVPVEAGGLSIVSQSGYLTRAAMVAARERNLGVQLAVSCGNEAVNGLADLIDHLVADPVTDVICVVLEKVRDAPGFFAALGRARAAGKPVVAVKLGRSERGRDIVRSHTGALATEGWVYDVGLRQAGVVLAEDLDDLLDRAHLLAQLPVLRRRPVRDIAVIASSGGVAALASDTLSGEGVGVPPLPQLLAAVQAQIPGAPHANPLDLTGFALDPPEKVERLVEVFTGSGTVDAVVVCWWLGDDDEARAELLLAPLRNVARRADIPLVMTTVETSRLGSWTSAAGDKVVCFGRGLRATVRGLAAVTEHLDGATRPRTPPPAPARGPLPRPEAVPSAAGPIAGFADAMTLLADHGLTVAPWTVVDDPAALAAGVELGRPGGTGPGVRAGAPSAVSGGAAVEAPAGTDLVVKLADVAHRTELGAVRVGVAPCDIEVVARELAGVARAQGVPGRIAVQGRMAGGGEAFVGYRAHTDLGPVVIVGLGGVLVERAQAVVGRLAPVSDQDVEDMLDELGRRGVFGGLRGQEPWDRTALAGAVKGVAELGARASGWLDSVDVNPLICDRYGCTAVDALLVLTDHPDGGV